MDNKISFDLKLTKEEQNFLEKYGYLHVLPLLKKIGFIKEESGWLNYPTFSLSDDDIANGYNTKLLENIHISTKEGV